MFLLLNLKTNLGFEIRKFEFKVTVHYGLYMGKMYPFVTLSWASKYQPGAIFINLVELVGKFPGLHTVM